MHKTWLRSTLSLLAAALVLLSGLGVLASPGVAAPRLETSLGHATALTAAAFADEDRLLITGAEDGSIIAWHMESGLPIHRITALGDGHEAIVSLSASADGAVVAAAGARGPIRVWNPSTEEVLCELRLEEDPRLLRLQVSADGTRLVLLTTDGRSSIGPAEGLLIYDTRSGERVQRVAQMEDADLVDFALSPDGAELLTATRGGRSESVLMRWSTSTGALLNTIDAGLEKPRWESVAYAGPYILAAGDGSIRAWRRADGALQPDLGVELVHQASHRAAAMTRDGRVYVAGGQQWREDRTTLAHVEVETGRLRLLAADAGEVEALAISDDGRRVVSSHDGDTLIVWDIGDKIEHKYLKGHASGRPISISPDGRHVLAQGEDRSVRLWDADTGEELLRLSPEAWRTDVDRYPRDLDLRAEDGLIATRSKGGGLQLWRMDSGALVREVPAERKSCSELPFQLLSAKGARVEKSCSNDHVAEVLDHKGRSVYKVERAETWSDLRRWLSVSPDGQQLAVWEKGCVVALHQPYADTPPRRLEAPGCRSGRPWAAAAWAEDGTLRVVDENGRLWSWRGSEPLELARPLLPIKQDALVQVNPHNLILTRYMAFDLLSQEATGAFPWLTAVEKGSYQTKDGAAIAISRSGRLTVVQHKDRGALVINTRTSETVLDIGRQSTPVRRMHFTGDGRQLVVEAGKALILWELGPDTQAHQADHGDDPPLPLRELVQGTPAGYTSRALPESVSLTEEEIWWGARAWTADTRWVLSARHHTPYAAVLEVPAEGPQRLHSFPLNDYQTTRRIGDVDEGLALVADTYTLTVRDLRSGQERLNLSFERTPGDGSGRDAAFVPGAGMVITSEARVVELWDLDPRQKVWSQPREAYAWRIEDELGVAPGADRFVLGASGTTATIRSLATGEVLFELPGHLGPIVAALSPDGRVAATGDRGGLVRLWDAHTGALLVTLYAFDAQDWAAVDPEGRFDVSRDGFTDLHWVINGDPILLEQLEARYFDPGLVGKRLGGSSQTLLNVEALAELKPPPKVELEPPSAEDPVLRMKLDDQGGGVGDLTITLNGSDVSAAAQRVEDAETGEVHVEIDLSALPYYRPGQENRVEAAAENADGSLVSRGGHGRFVDPGPPASRPPQLWAVVIGTHDYRGDDLDLRYPAEDAARFATGLELAASSLFGADNVHLRLLSTGEGHTPPTKANIVDALSSLSQASTEDVIVVFLSGHGAARSDPEDYFYLTTEVASLRDLEDPSLRDARSLSGAELTELLLASPAGKRVLILDTCAAGKVLDNLAEERELPSSQVRAMERLKDRTGTYILAGAAADKVSYEATRYGQGLLTYSLLEGMRGAALREEQFVDVEVWFQHSRERVPELAEGIGGVQTPVLRGPAGGGSFDVGLLEPEQRGDIPLLPSRAVLVRSSFQDAALMVDELGLGVAVDEALRRTAAAGEDAPIVFFDAASYPDAGRVVGRYEIDGDQVTVSAILVIGDERRALSAQGAAGELDALAEQLTQEVLGALRAEQAR